MKALQVTGSVSKKNHQGTVVLAEFVVLKPATPPLWLLKRCRLDLTAIDF